jgi:hypothetical protein
LLENRQWAIRFAKQIYVQLAEIFANKTELCCKQIWHYLFAKEGKTNK